MYVETNYTVIKDFYHLGKGIIRRDPVSIIVKSDTAFNALVGEMTRQTDRIKQAGKFSYTALASKTKLTGIVLRTDGALTLYKAYPNTMIIF